ncbi:MAG TPA: DUF2795 domain-containing protein [Gaiellaceae bacterium]|nr:DUF2795 domain-containing protein [Gaiellaceae bacterium]
MGEARGKALYASDGERLGGVEAVLDDIETRKPEWFALGTGSLGGKRVLVPVEGSEARGEGIFVRYSAEQIRSAPELAGDEISQEAERRLYSHYGLPYSERRSGTGLPERPQRGETAGRQRFAGREGRSSRDEPTRDELYEEAKRLDIEGRSKMNKRELLRAVEQARGTATGRSEGQRDSRAKANPIEVQKFLEGVGYPTGKRALVQEAKRQGASEDVRETLERLPDEEFETPTDVSEAIGKLS